MDSTPNTYNDAIANNVVTNVITKLHPLYIKS